MVKPGKHLIIFKASQFVLCLALTMKPMQNYTFVWNDISENICKDTHKLNTDKGGNCTM